MLFLPVLVVAHKKARSFFNNIYKKFLCGTLLVGACYFNHKPGHSCCYRNAVNTSAAGIKVGPFWKLAANKFPFIRCLTADRAYLCIVVVKVVSIRQ